MSVLPYLASASIGAVIGLAAAIVYYNQSSERKQRKRKTSDSSFVSEAIFFPDDDVEDVLSEEAVGMLYRSFLDSSKPFKRLRAHFKTARKSIDICLFLLTSQDLADVVLSRIKKGVRVRLIIDDANVRIDGSQVNEFLRKGAFVYHKRSVGNNLMHHKFALIDGKRLVTGSFNWTMKAVMGNKENVLVTEDPGLVSAYQSEFNKLLAQMPQNEY